MYTVQCATIKKYHYFRHGSIFFHKILEVIPGTICYYCCEFYHFIFRSSQITQL